MSHSFVKCWLHALWATKARNPLIHPSKENIVYLKIEEELKACGCFVKIVNGIPDHVHGLFTLNPTLALSDIMGRVKGSSSNWINQQDILRMKFAWQTGYTAYSVSESMVEKVYNYIKNQKSHHKVRSWQEELAELNRIHGMDSNYATTDGV